MYSDLALVRRLLRILYPLRWTIVFSASMRIVKMVTATALIAIAASAVFSYVAEPSATVLWRSVGWLVLAAAVLGVSHYLEQFSGHYVAFVLLALLRNQFYDAMEPLAPAKTAKLQSGDAVARVISDCERIEPFYAHTIAPMIAAAFVPIILLAYVWTVHPAFALTLLPFFLLIGIGGPLLILGLGRQGGREWREMQGKVNAFLTDSIQGLRDTIAFGYGERRAEEIRGMGNTLRRGQDKLYRADSLQRGVSEFLVTTAILATAWVGATLAQEGLIDPLRDIPVALAVAVTGFAVSTGLANAFGDFGVSMVCARRLFELMDQTPAVNDAGQLAPSRPSSSVHFDDVSFEYDAGDAAWSRNHSALSHVDFDIDQGRRIAVVGPTGAGKSTIVNLIMRHWDPQRGEVAVGDVNVKDLPLAELRKHVAVVSQRSYIFNTSIGENIRLGKPDATPAEIEDAARQANLAQWIDTLPDGYDTRVGEAGSKLSGGQRQRVAIARAILKNAPIIVLDEATSNLDVETEKDVFVALRRLTEGRTTLTVAHRLSTVVDADEIFVMKDGAIVERGSHDELMSKGGWYARMFTLQLDDVEAALESGASA